MNVCEKSYIFALSPGFRSNGYEKSNTNSSIRGFLTNVYEKSYTLLFLALVRQRDLAFVRSSALRSNERRLRIRRQTLISTLSQFEKSYSRRFRSYDSVSAYVDFVIFQFV